MKKNYSAKNYFWFTFHFFWGSVLGCCITVIATFSSVAILMVLDTRIELVDTLIPYIFWTTLVGVLYLVWFVTSEDAFI